MNKYLVCIDSEFVSAPTVLDNSTGDWDDDKSIVEFKHSYPVVLGEYYGEDETVAKEAAAAANDLSPDTLTTYKLYTPELNDVIREEILIMVDDTEAYTFTQEQIEYIKANLDQIVAGMDFHDEAFMELITGALDEYTGANPNYPVSHIVPVKFVTDTGEVEVRTNAKLNTETGEVTDIVIDQNVEVKGEITDFYIELGSGERQDICITEAGRYYLED